MNFFNEKEIKWPNINKKAEQRYMTEVLTSFPCVNHSYFIYKLGGNEILAPEHVNIDPRALFSSSRDFGVPTFRDSENLLFKQCHTTT